MNDKKEVSVRKIFGDVFEIIFSRDFQKIYWPLCVVSGLLLVLVVSLYFVLLFFFDGSGGGNFGRGISFAIRAIWWIMLLVLGSWIFLFHLRIVSEGIGKRDVNWREAVTFANKNLLRNIGMMVMILFLFLVMFGMTFGISWAIEMGLFWVSVKLGVIMIKKLGLIISGLLTLMGVICLLYVVVRLVLAPYHVFLGDRPVIRGMVESWQASKERFWLVVRWKLSVLICSVLVILIGVVVDVLLNLLPKVIGVLVGGIIEIGFQPFISCFMIGTGYLLYENLMVEE